MTPTRNDQYALRSGYISRNSMMDEHFNSNKDSPALVTSVNMSTMFPVFANLNSMALTPLRINSRLDAITTRPSIEHPRNGYLCTPSHQFIFNMSL